MYRKLRGSESLKEFVSEVGDDILKRLEKKKERDSEDPDTELFKNFIKRLSQENITLSESLIKLAIAQKTEDKADDYEYDPIIKFAINHLRALQVLKLSIASNK